MAIPLDRDLISEVITKRFGSFDGFIDHWYSLADIGVQRKKSPRDRTTVYRWLKEGLPSRKDELFDFAGALDMDPVALMAINREFIAKRFPEERLSLQQRLSKQSPLKPFHAIYFPAWKWPNSSLATRHFGRNWHLEDFSHEADAKINFYASLWIKDLQGPTGDHPRVYHIAYMRKNSLDRLWRPFGTVISRPDKAILVHENGDYQEKIGQRSTGEVAFETYYGPTPVHFRLASIHSFKIADVQDSSGEGNLRFVA